MSAGLIKRIADEIQALSIDMGPELVSRFQSHFDVLSQLTSAASLELIEQIKTQTPLNDAELATALKSGQPVLVMFKNAFCEDDWYDEGMLARITGLHWSDGTECFKMTVDAAGFEAYNFPLMKPVYYSNRHTDDKVRKGLIKESGLYTALEAEMYQPVTQGYWSVVIDGEERTPENYDGDIHQMLAYSLIEEIGTFYAEPSR
jgi:hypothetical protein